MKIMAYIAFGVLSFGYLSVFFGLYLSKQPNFYAGLSLLREALAAFFTHATAILVLGYIYTKLTVYLFDKDYFFVVVGVMMAANLFSFSFYFFSSKGQHPEVGS